jgi:hypothetical protein
LIGRKNLFNNNNNDKYNFRDHSKVYEEPMKIINNKKSQDNLMNNNNAFPEPKAYVNENKYSIKGKILIRGYSEDFKNNNLYNRPKTSKTRNNPNNNSSCKSQEKNISKNYSRAKNNYNINCSSTFEKVLLLKKKSQNELETSNKSTKDISNNIKKESSKENLY